MVFWVNTSSDDILKNFFEKTKNETKSILEELILGNSIECKYNDKVTFLDLNLIDKSESTDIVLNFLLTSGYLTKEKGSSLSASGNIPVRIPNNEVKTIYVEILSKWIKDASNLNTLMLIEFKKVMLAHDTEKLENMLNDVLNHMSYVDGQESFYHGYMLGLLVEFLNREYIVKSNRESGNGRFDIMIEAVDRSVGIVFEFKVAKDDESLEERALTGKEQILNKEYFRELELDRVQNVITYGVAFRGKECRVV